MRLSVFVVGYCQFDWVSEGCVEYFKCMLCELLVSVIEIKFELCGLKMCE